jgi:hypothetical protein
LESRHGQSRPKTDGTRPYAGSLVRLFVNSLKHKDVAHGPQLKGFYKIVVFEIFKKIVSC